jgi:hypothetical protein
MIDRSAIEENGDEESVVYSYHNINKCLAPCRYTNGVLYCSNCLT